MQDFNVLVSEGLFIFCTLLRVSREDVSSSINFTLIIIDSEVVTREFLGPAKLPGAQTLLIHKLVEVLVVGKYKNFMLRAF